MRTTVEQQLPTDLGTLRKFLEAATRLVDADMTAVVSYVDGPGKFLRICSAREFEES